MTRLLLDTNILAAGATQRVYEQMLEVYHDAQFITTEAVMRELDQLIEQATGEEKRTFALAKQIAQKQPLNMEPVSVQYADDSLLELAGEDDYIVTRDKELQKRAIAQDRLVLGIDKHGKPYPIHR